MNWAVRMLRVSDIDIFFWNELMVTPTKFLQPQLQVISTQLISKPKALKENRQ